MAEPQLAQVFAAFGLDGEPERLSGGSQVALLVGDVVLKRIGETSLENKHSPELAAWIASFSRALKQDGFRFPRALPTTDGRWITSDGWTAWSYLDGRHAEAADIPAVIEAIYALHRELAPVERHPLLSANTTVWGLADAACWGERPEQVDLRVAPLLDRLYALRQPIPTSQSQLIHGDLNPENILISPTAPPAFIDLAPFWRPVEFAVAMFANWIGPRRGDSNALAHFQHVPNFAQLLLRASIRMLLVMDDFSGWERSSEKRAGELVIEHVEAS